MEWLSFIFQQETLFVLIPVAVIIAIFAIAALKAHQKHQARIEKIKRGMDFE